MLFMVSNCACNSYSVLSVIGFESSFHDASCKCATRLKFDENSRFLFLRIAGLAQCDSFTVSLNISVFNLEFSLSL